MIQAERLSPQTMLSIANARQEAKRSGNRLVGTEHLLLGIVVSGETKLREILDSTGLTETAVRQAADKILGAPREPHDRDDLDFTPRVQRLIDRGFAEAQLLGAPLVEPRHILLAVLREDAGIASRILERLETNTTTLLKLLLSK